MATPNRPSIVPEAYDGSGSWEQWILHFCNAAAVNEWDNGAKLKWLRVRLTGKAQIAFERLTTETKADYSRAVKALGERFNPSSCKTRYQAELQTRRKRKEENWADLADNLRTLADKAYPDLEDKARERLALNAYLSQLENPHIAFGVKQKTPQTLDEAVAATLELESYLSPKLATAPSVSTVSPSPQEPEQAGISAVSQASNDKLLSMFEQLVSRFDKLEAAYSTGRRSNNSRPDYQSSGSNGRNRSPRQPGQIVCWNCTGLGHMQRQCPFPRQPQTIQQWQSPPRQPQPWTPQPVQPPATQNLPQGDPFNQQGN